MDMSESELTLGKVIQEKREKLDMTQRELARAIHLNHATISRIENNPDIVADPSKSDERRQPSRRQRQKWRSGAGADDGNPTKQFCYSLPGC